MNNIISGNSINLEKVFSVRIWIYKNEVKKKKKTIQKIKSLIRLFYKTVFKSIFTFPKITFSENKKQSIFYIRKYSRLDINKHSKNYEKVDGTTVCIFSQRIRKISILSFLISIFFLIKFRKPLIKVLSKNQINFFSIIAMEIFFEFFYDISDIVKIFPFLSKHSKLVSFQEMSPIENLICQIANILNIKTFALQHAVGAFSDSGDYEVRYPIISYLNTVCKNILCWGIFNKNIYKKFTNANIFIVGKASMPEQKEFLDGVTIIFEDTFSKLSNNELLNISQKLIENNISVSRWFKKNHSLIKNVEGRDGPLRKTVIGTKSSLLFELGYLGCEVYFSKETNLREIIPDDLIIDDFNLFLKNLKNNKIYPHNIWKNFIECTGKESVNRYEKILFS